VVARLRDIDAASAAASQSLIAIEPAAPFLEFA
jgi:hypothetical protein